MNIKIKAITLLATFSISSYAPAVTLSGTALLNVQGSTPGTDLVVGRLGLLIVDNDNDGFLFGGGNASISSGNPITPDTYTASGANLSVDSTFYGDTILARLTTAAPFSDTTMSGNLSRSVGASYLGKSFAIVWFETLTTAGSETLGSGNFGIARGGDWVLPAADGDSLTYGGANLDQITLTNVLNGTATSTGSVAFATAGTTLTIIPEPSTFLLTSMGVLALLRRRR